MGLEQLAVGPAGGLAFPGTRLLARGVVELRFRGCVRTGRRSLAVRARLELGQRLTGRSFDRSNPVGNPFRRVLESMGGLVAATMRLFEVGRLDPEPIALEQAAHAGLARFRAWMLAVLAVHLVVRLVMLRLLVGGDVALVVAEHDLVVRVADQVVRPHRDLAAAAGRVGRIGWNRVAGGVRAQPLHDLEALADRSAEVARALNQVALVDVCLLYTYDAADE